MIGSATYFALSVLVNPINSEVVYSKDIKPIVQKHCAQCHGSNITDYDRIYKIRKKIKTRVWILMDMPKGKHNMTLPERKKIKIWIDQGAKK